MQKSLTRHTVVHMYGRRVVLLVKDLLTPPCAFKFLDRVGIYKHLQAFTSYLHSSRAWQWAWFRVTRPNNLPRLICYQPGLMSKLKWSSQLHASDRIILEAFQIPPRAALSTYVFSIEPELKLSSVTRTVSVTWL